VYGQTGSGTGTQVRIYIKSTDLGEEDTSDGCKTEEFPCRRKIRDDFIPYSEKYPPPTRALNTFAP
jgi:hypothetical protein